MNQLPKSPGAGKEFTEIGEHVLTIKSAELGTSKSSGTPQIAVTFVTPKDQWVREWYQISESEFMMFKLGRLVDALELDLGNAEVSLEDLARIIPVGAKVFGCLDVNDRGYGTIDYSDKNGGWGIKSLSEAAPSSDKIDITSDDLPFNKATEAPTHNEPVLETTPEVLTSDDF